MSVSGMKRAEGQTQIRYFAFIFFISSEECVTNDWIKFKTHAENVYIAHVGIV
jgi:hypothetical protein